MFLRWLIEAGTLTQQSWRIVQKFCLKINSFDFVLISFVHVYFVILLSKLLMSCKLLNQINSIRYSHILAQTLLWRTRKQRKEKLLAKMLKDKAQICCRSSGLWHLLMKKKEYHQFLIFWRKLKAVKNRLESVKIC